MKTLGLTLVTLGLVLSAAPLAASQEEGQTAFTLTSHTENGAFYWTLEGQTAKNPTLVVTPNAEITITIKNTDGGFHNLQVGSNPPSEYIEAEGDEKTYTFTAPASGTLDYFCVPHKSSGMKGTIRVAGTAVEEKKESPGVQVVGVSIALLGAALILRRR